MVHWRDLIEEAAATGRMHPVVIADLDMKNFFNTVEWPAIRSSMERILPEAMAYAKQQVIEHGYDATACKLIDYWVSPRYQVSGWAGAWGEHLYVPLIYKVRPDIAFTAEKIHEDYYCVADTTRKLPTQNPHRLDDNVIMHHMTTVRAQREGLISKYKNRSSHIPPVLPAEHMGDLLRSWVPNKNWGPVTQEVEDIFSIDGSRKLQQAALNGITGNFISQII